MRRIVEANRCMAALGLRHRYRLRNRTSNSEVQMYDSTWGQQGAQQYQQPLDAAACAPAIKTLSLKQFILAHARLKAQAAPSGWAGSSGE
jgi:hypothetical protein